MDVKTQNALKKMIELAEEEINENHMPNILKELNIKEPLYFKFKELPKDK